MDPEAVAAFEGRKVLAKEVQCMMVEILMARADGWVGPTCAGIGDDGDHGCEEVRAWDGWVGPTCAGIGDDGDHGCEEVRAWDGEGDGDDEDGDDDCEGFGWHGDGGGHEVIDLPVEEISSDSGEEGFVVRTPSMLDSDEGFVVPMPEEALDI
eukprot:gnl/TRDRNA2_/TRDRNA2_78064_c0_seq1.p3 gnl/TRDRNA2_/TRDRNA2_78064_c0~~gnl/TRDRNA2_/TRDRNA2_78064_c0_seq1.p3  ORF type:complete len:153 (-),score=39.98 gnl/TRDRNA2_/TRDRNA2_78064_c0_seq1:127-585(-)